MTFIITLFILAITCIPAMALIFFGMIGLFTLIEMLGMEPQIVLQIIGAFAVAVAIFKLVWITYWFHVSKHVFPTFHDHWFNNNKDSL